MAWVGFFAHKQRPAQEMKVLIYAVTSNLVFTAICHMSHSIRKLTGLFEFRLTKFRKVREIPSDMPSGWGLNVTMEDKHGGTYTEYGTSRLRTRLDTASRIITTKLEARTGERLCFRLQGKGPFLDFDDKDHASSDHSRRSSDRLSPGPPFVGWAPYALCIKILVDGKELTPAMDVMYLTPHSPVMSAGKVVDSCAIKTGVSGEGEALYREHDWVFTEVGIEVRLAQLGLSSSLDAENGDRSTAPSNDSIHSDSISSNAGTIEVQLFRFVVEESKSDQRAQRSGMIEEKPHLGKKVAEYDEVNDSGSSNAETTAIDPNVTHTVEVVDRGEADVVCELVNGYYPDTDCEPYARYRFQYMSLTKLVKVGVANPDRSIVAPGQRRARIQQLGLNTTADTPSRISKRKPAGDDENTHVRIPTNVSKRQNQREYDGRYGQGQMVIPFRDKSHSGGRWLRSSQKQNPQSDFLPLGIPSEHPNAQSGQEHLESRLADLTLKYPVAEDNTSLQKDTEVQKKRLTPSNGEEELDMPITT